MPLKDYTWSPTYGASALASELQLKERTEAVLSLYGLLWGLAGLESSIFVQGNVVLIPLYGWMRA